MIQLKDYKNLINLNRLEKSKIKLSTKEKEKLVDKLLDILNKEFNLQLKFSGDYTSKRRLLWGILNELQPYDLGDKFYALQDKLLSSEVNDRKVYDVEEFDYKNNIALFYGDITTLKCDAIVNAGNNRLLGCFLPLHTCIDNIIISRGGFQIRNDLNTIMHRQSGEFSEYFEPCGKAKITSAYNLPCDYIIHTVGPMVDEDDLTKQDRVDLVNCYISSLNLAKEMGLKSIAFCCISTGEFNFPHDVACDVAVESVRAWMKNNTYPIKVIFDVFKEEDKELYERKLSK